MSFDALDAELVEFAPLDLLDFDAGGGLDAYLEDTRDSSERLFATGELEELRLPPASSRKRVLGEQTERRRLQQVASARRHRRRKKSELEGLQTVVRLLEQQLEQLRRARGAQLPSASVARWEEHAARERLERQRSEAVNDRLRSAVYVHGEYVRSFRRVFSSPCAMSAELNMLHLLHSRVYLGRSPASRERELRAMLSDDKLDRAIRILERETSGASLEAPSLDTRPVRANADQVGVTCTCVFAVESADVGAVFHSIASMALQLGFGWPDHSVVASDARFIEAPAPSARYGVFGTRYARSAVDHEVVLAGRVLSSHRVTDSHAVLVWDFADADALHPLPSDAAVRRDVTGALFVRQETCPDGEQRVVCRVACTKLHTLQLQRPSAEALASARQFANLAVAGAEKCNAAVWSAGKQHEHAAPRFEASV